MKMHEKLKEIRIRQGLSINKASILSGVPHASIRRLEEGTVNPTVWTVERLCKAYKVNVWDVMNPKTR